MFIDQARIYVKAGDGGDGCNSMFRDIFNRIGRPDGGPGGRGGDIIFAADANIHTLLDLHYRQHIKGQSGGHASSNHKKGSRGEDIIVRVPAGTLIKDERTGLVLRDLVKPGDRVIAAKGGDGGKGNSRGRDAQPGFPGEEKTLLLELKIMADAGIIGYPNSGKSTLISRISSARPKIASYPFTTKAPNLGVVKIYKDSEPIVVADIPGLIEGAHKGKGLGDRFLRHIERNRFLIHLVDISAFEGRDPFLDYTSLNEELKLYSPALSSKPQIIVLNKMDLHGAKENLKVFKKQLGRKKVFPISALTGDGIPDLLKELYKKAHGKQYGTL